MASRMPLFFHPYYLIQHTQMKKKKRKKAETIANILENQNFLRNPHYKEQLTSGIGIMGLIVQYSPSI